MIVNTLILVLLGVFLYIYWFYKKSYSYFEKRDIPFVKPSLIFGNIGEVIFKKKSLSDVHEEIYHKLEPHKVGGMFNLHKAAYVIRDPEIIKTIFIKDFENFPDRGSPLNAEDEPLTNHLANMTGDIWKNLRIKLTPTFSTGKMKMMFPLIKSCGDKLTEVLEHFSPEDDIDVKDLCSRFTTDVIGTCAFGLETNSLANPNSEFREISKDIFDFRIQAFIRQFFPNLSPKIIRFFGLYVFDKKIHRFFYPIVNDTIKYREENKVTRYDFLDLLIKLKNNTDIHNFQDKHDTKDLEKFLSEIGNKTIKSDVDMTSDLLVAQCFLFFAAGFETSSTALNMLLLELAKNPEIQNKVREEIITVLESNEDELTYELMKKMKYTDMVIAETLRRHPPGGMIPRKCIKSCTIPGTTITINENEVCTISVQGLHSDKKYYERPDEFYPEHFTEEAIASRPHFSYLPFGEGPRMCIAARFAKMEIKTALVYFLKNFSYKVSPKMKFPIKHVPSIGLLAVEGGVWLNCEKI